jgi:hypothetical protein
VDGILETNAEILDWINIENTGDFGRNQFKNTDLGLSMGLAFEFNILKLGVNYNFGFPQAAENNEASEILIGDARNNVIQGFVGLAF